MAKAANPAPETEREAWAIEPMRFRFQLGENQFYARTLDTAVYQRRFLDIVATGEDPTSLALPLDRFGGQVAAYVALSHPIDKPLPILQQEPQAIRYASHQYRRGYVQVAGTFDDYLKGMSSNRRNQLKRKVKKFKERAGALALEEFKDEAGLAVFHREARQVSVKTYQEKLFKKGLLDTPDFLADMAARGRNHRGDQGKAQARGYLLRLEGKAVAYLYAVIDDGFLTYDFVGFDPEYADLSPGNVLQYLILERVFTDHTCEVFDFGEGESQYKDFFATHTVQCADIYWFPRDPRGYALAASQAGLFYLSRGIVQTLDRLGIKKRVKQLLRGGGWSATEPGSGPAEGAAKGDAQG